ncbi:MAG: DUF4364 family protein, partial [Clostridiales bacterium]|nr:DUF4364 family protein [Clostridiales bacterium]
MAAYRELGRISDPTILKFFVLYVLQALGGSTAKSALGEVAMMTESASYFDYAQALDALLSTGHIAVGEEGSYTITPLGEDAHGHFYNQVPTWVRGRVGRAVME